MAMPTAKAASVNLGACRFSKPCWLARSTPESNGCFANSSKEVLVTKEKLDGRLLAIVSARSVVAFKPDPSPLTFSESSVQMPRR